MAGKEFVMRLYLIIAVLTFVITSSLLFSKTNRWIESTAIGAVVAITWPAFVAFGVAIEISPHINSKRKNHYSDTVCWRGLIE